MAVGEAVGVGVGVGVAVLVGSTGITATCAKPALAWAPSRTVGVGVGEGVGVSRLGDGGATPWDSAAGGAFLTPGSRPACQRAYAATPTISR